MYCPNPFLFTNFLLPTYNTIIPGKNALSFAKDTVYRFMKSVQINWLDGREHLYPGQQCPAVFGKQENRINDAASATYIVHEKSTI